MRTLRSSHARRVGTGKTPTKTKFQRTKVRRHHHRRFAGVRGQPRGTHERNVRKANTNVTIRLARSGKKRRFFGRRKSTVPRRKPGTAPVYVRKGRHGPRRFLGRKKSTVKRHVRPGLKRKFKGRKKVTMRKGLHRRFLGRKKSTKKRAYHGRKKSVKPIRAGSVLSSQSYIAMFS